MGSSPSRGLPRRLPPRFWLTALAFVTLVCGVMAVVFVRSLGGDQAEGQGFQQPDSELTKAGASVLDGYSKTGKGPSPSAEPEVLGKGTASQTQERPTIRLKVRIEPPSARLRIDGM